MNLQETLNEGLKFQNLSISESKKSRLLALIDLLEKWNKVFNLTAVRDKREMVTRHLLDSLSVLKFIRPSSTIADLGSGGGFPGLPLAICETENKFTLIDSNRKKTRFLVHAKTSLNLRNVEVLNIRIEEHKQKVLFDCLISRAFASPAETAIKASHLVKSGGSLILMMAHVDKTLIEKIDGFSLQKIVPVQIYNEQSTRHVVIFTKMSEA